jgi:hypothetical protein
VKEACHLKDRNNSGGLCWLIENLVDFSWRPTSKILKFCKDPPAKSFQMASLFGPEWAAGSIECPSQLRLPVVSRSGALLMSRCGRDQPAGSHLTPLLALLVLRFFSLPLNGPR